MEAISQVRKSNWVKTTTLVLTAGVIFPFLVHLIPPYRGVPIGAYLLPMFYIPFLAVMWHKWKVALPVALFAPILNFLITGNPQWGFMGILTFELLVFIGIAGLLLMHAHAKWIAAPLGYVGAKALSSLLLTLFPLLPAQPLDFFTTSLSHAVPGLLMLWLINILALKYWPKEKNSF